MLTKINLPKGENSMSTILTSAIVDGAKGAVDSYITSINSLNGELESILNTLTGDSFTGEASNGYRDFYTTKILPAITENLIDQGKSLTASIKSMLDNIQQQLLNTVDPQLGENNRNPGGAAAGAAAGVATAAIN